MPVPIFFVYVNLKTICIIQKIILTLRLEKIEH